VLHPVSGIAKCPGCRQPAATGPDNPWRPFCSERCRLIDLGDWLTGRHAIPVTDEIPPEPESGGETRH
jgi:endogenous inhibitor of DNA gyrase (YacG/DUF329 family)